MTILSSYTPEEVDLIISLPYRVGMNVSYSEDESGDVDDVLEMKALESVLQNVVQREAESPDSLTGEIAQAVLDSRDKWESWGQGVFNIEPLCEKAVLTLRKQASIEEAKEYIHMCLDVATSVAQAYGEFGEHEYDPVPEEEQTGLIGSIVKEISKLVSGKHTVQQAGHPMNVSAAEDTAITRITAAMKKALGCDL